jgi:hypothetical protein
MPANDRVEVLIRKFADDLQAIVREQLSSQVTNAVQTALGGGRPTGRRAAASTSNGGGGAGGKRTPEQIDKQAERLLAFIKANPDQRAEQIAKANRMTTTELVLPMKRLLDEKSIKSSGKARGTTYAAVK